MKQKLTIGRDERKEGRKNYMKGGRIGGRKEVSVQGFLIQKKAKKKKKREKNRKRI
jgi:hypothetical protein